MASNALRRAIDVYCIKEIGLETKEDIVELATWFFNIYIDEKAEIKNESDAKHDGAPF